MGELHQRGGAKACAGRDPALRGGELPPVYDPFLGWWVDPAGGATVGLPAYGSDLNPVAVMIGKAMIEIPPKFKDMEPSHPGIKDRSFYRNAKDWRRM